VEPTEFNTILDPSRDGLILHLRFGESKYPNLEDISSLLYDLVLIHDLGAMLVLSEYRQYHFTQYFTYRNHRRLAPKHKLRTVAISKRSPLWLDLVGSATGIWALIQLVDKVANWKLNKKKLLLEIQKLEYEVALKHVEVLEKTKVLEEQLQRRDAMSMANRLIRRLEQSPMNLEDADVSGTNHGPDES